MALFIRILKAHTGFEVDAHILCGLQYIIPKLPKELEKLQKNYNRIKQALNAHKHTWFGENPDNSVMDPFFQYCILPRVVVSVADAAYCAKFILMLHATEAPNFASVYCIDKVGSLHFDDGRPF